MCAILEKGAPPASLMLRNFYVVPTIVEPSAGRLACCHLNRQPHDRTDRVIPAKAGIQPPSVVFLALGPLIEGTAQRVDHLLATA
jgi:hypothetical protein